MSEIDRVMGQIMSEPVAAQSLGLEAYDLRLLRYQKKGPPFYKPTGGRNMPTFYHERDLKNWRQTPEGARIIKSRQTRTTINPAAAASAAAATAA